MPWLEGDDGPLQRRVSTTFEEGLLSDHVEPDAMHYWFTEPEGGWPTGKRRMKLAEKLPQDDALVSDNPYHEFDETRTPLADLVEDATITGTVVSQMFFFGVLVDFGAEYDGLVPLNDQDQWDALGDRFQVGETVQAVVFRVRDPVLFRYPVQLVPADAELAAALPDPATHMPTMDLRDVTMDLEQLAAIGGRDYKGTDFMLPLEDELDFALDGGALDEQIAAAAAKQENRPTSPDEDLDVLATWLMQ